MDYLAFTRERIGPNWVIARRTPRIIAKYGEDVICISQKRMASIDKEYRALYGDPYDKPRAAMYLALVNARAELEIFGRQSSETYRLVCEAIAGELARP